MTKGKIMKISMPIAWGGSDENETIIDVLDEIQKNVPSASFRIVEAHPAHSGGWPIIEIEFRDEDLGSLCDLMDLDEFDVDIRV